MLPRPPDVRTPGPLAALALSGCVLLAGCGRPGLTVTGGVAVVRTHGAVVSLLAGAAAAGSRLVVRPAEPTDPGAPSWLRSGSGLSVSLTRGRTTIAVLAEPDLDLELPVPAGADAGHVPVVRWRTPTGGWQTLQTSWEPGQRTVHAVTTDATGGYVGLVDLAAARAATAPLPRAIAAPTCSGAAAGTSVRSTGGGPVDWCAGASGGREQLRFIATDDGWASVELPQTWTVAAGPLREDVVALGQNVRADGLVDWLVRPGTTLVATVPVGVGGIVAAGRDESADYTGEVLAALARIAAVAGPLAPALAARATATAADVVAEAVADASDSSDADPTDGTRDLPPAEYGCDDGIVDTDGTSPQDAAPTTPLAPATCALALVAADATDHHDDAATAQLAAVDDVLVAALGAALATGPSGDLLVTVTTASRVPTLGTADVSGRGGYGTVRPATLSDGGDPSGVLSGITWRSWGGATAVGHGTALYVAPDGTVAGSRPAPATVLAYDLGSCDGHPAYRAVEWWFPGHGQTFVPAWATDACLTL